MAQNLNQEAKSPIAVSKRLPEFDLLNIFLGRWYLDGYLGINSSAGIGKHVLGEDSFEWAPDKQSLQFSWSRTTDEETRNEVGLITYDLVGKNLVTHTRNQGGTEKTYRTLMSGRTLTLRGDSERALINVSIDEHMTINWEQRTDSRKWVPLCELRGSKNKQIFS